MKTVTFPFGEKRLEFDIPAENLIGVFSPAPGRPLADLESAIARALQNPIGQKRLRERVKPGDSVLIVSDDITRTTPARLILPHLLAELNAAGVSDARISCIMALGTHRYMTREEMSAKVGARVFERIRVFNHEWRSPEALVDLGVSVQGTPLVVNRAVVEADVVIGLGAIVPHHIPGYSGSSKIIQPGICSPRTTAETHLLACSGGGDSFLGIAENPVRRDMDDMASRVGMDTIFNVVMHTDGGVEGVFFGEIRAAFAEGVHLAREIYGFPYDETPDIVVANSAPCDLDFWQSHKSLYPAQRMIKPGGSIVVLTPAPEGVSPVHTDLLDYTAWPSGEILDAYRRGELKNGVATALAVAWAMAREKAPVILFSPGIRQEEAARLGFTHARDLDAAIGEAFRRQGKSARVAVLTHAPEMLPVRRGA
jgi:lactate racemase